jgi:hypothetical protein
MCINDGSSLVLYQNITKVCLHNALCIRIYIVSSSCAGTSFLITLFDRFFDRSITFKLSHSLTESPFKTTLQFTMSFQSLFLAASAILATANAHVVMKSPVPYSVDKLDNSPITKSQYPCKSQNGFTVSTMNPMKAGEKQTLKLFGSAVHGGGSCQLSVTLDTEPTAASVFKVIQSMEGGCPGVDSAAKDYDFTLPASIPNGKATFAWTWNSKLSGQPELYMNCAPIEVTGGASDKTAFEALPDMLVANLDKSCEEVPNSAVQYPNPGKVVVQGGTNDLKAPVGASCGKSSGQPSSPDPSSPAGGSPAASSAPQSSAAAQPSAPASPSVPADGAPSAPAASAPAASAPPSNPGGVFAPGASGTPTSTTLVTVTAAPTPAQPTVPASGGTGTPAAPSSPSTGVGSAPSTPGAGGASGTCSSNGAVVCNGEKQFGLCNNGQVVWQDVASGTACVNGVISKRSLQGRVARPRYNRKVAV